MTDKNRVGWKPMKAMPLLAETRLNQNAVIDSDSDSILK